MRRVLIYAFSTPSSVADNSAEHDTLFV